MNYFEKLNNINVSDKIEKKNNLSYLSWSYAWSELKKAYPMSQYKIYESENGNFYHSDGKTCWVKTGVTVVYENKELEHIEYLPVMDFRNKAIPLANVTSTDVNKAIQRSLTKAVARHGLGLYIYAGEDLPTAEKVDLPIKTEMPIKEETPIFNNNNNINFKVAYECEKCGKPFIDFEYKGQKYTAKQAYDKAKKRNNGGIALCKDCLASENSNVVNFENI